jgi:hypothetical protein
MVDDFVPEEISYEPDFESESQLGPEKASSSSIYDDDFEAES